MHPKLRGIIPQFAQTALPSDVWRQPEHVGGALGLKPGPRPTELRPIGINGKAQPRAARRRALGAPAPHRWTNPYRGIVVPFEVGLTSRLIISANLNRCYVLIQNLNAAQDMWLNFGNAAGLEASVLLIPRGNYELIGGIGGGAFSPMDSVHVLGTVANQRGIIVQGVPWAENS